MDDRQKQPVNAFVLILVILFGALCIRHLFNLTKKIRTTTLPNFYKFEILAEDSRAANSEWVYLMLGATAFHATFYGVVERPKRYDTSSDGGSGSSSGGSSCGNSCGSSCGSSCGGCGGGD